MAAQFCRRDLMAYGKVHIRNYQVVVGCNKGQNGAAIFRSRHLSFDPKSVEGTPVAGVFILFVEDHGPETGVGYYNPGNEWILARAPLSDFDQMYRVLQTEKSALFHWAADDSNNLHWFQVATGAEAAGGGDLNSIQLAARLMEDPKRE